MVTIVRETKTAITSIYIPTKVVAEESKRREYLANLAKGYNASSLCCWMKLPNGRLKAYFWASTGLECRTYSSIEVTDALFHKKPLFLHSAEAILTQMEEPILVAA